MHKKKTLDISTVLVRIVFLNINCHDTVVKISAVYAVVTACEQINKLWFHSVYCDNESLLIGGVLLEYCSFGCCLKIALLQLKHFRGGKNRNPN